MMKSRLPARLSDMWRHLNDAVVGISTGELYAGAGDRIDGAILSALDQIIAIVQEQLAAARDRPSDRRSGGAVAQAGRSGIF